MLVIFEGPDCVGKSTFVQRVAQRIRERYAEHSVEILKKGPPKAHPLDEYVIPLCDYRPLRSRHILCDRWHWGERVYPVLWKRSTQMDNAVWRYVEMFLKSRGAVVVHLTRNREDHQHCLNTRGDDHGVVAGDLDSLYGLYQRTRTDSLLHNLSLDIEVSDRIVDKLIDHVALSEKITAELNTFTTYVGPQQAKILLVGDVRNATRDDEPLADGLFPAFGPYPSTSGHYLMHTLAQQFPLRMGDIGLVNACDVDDVSCVIRATNSASIVALGKNADLTLRRLDSPVKYGAVPHPQYWRRFYHHNVSEYGRLIDRAARHREDLLQWRPT